MTKFTTTSLADLLRIHLGPKELNDITAALLGYERKPIELGIAASFELMDGNIGGSFDGPFREEPIEEVVFPTDQPKLAVLLAMTAETLKTESTEPLLGNPIRSEELKCPTGKRGLPLGPLIHWPRLRRWMKQCLGKEVRGTRLDERKLIRRISGGIPLIDLPRQMRSTWSSRIAILWDETREMYPFRRDVAWLCRQLRRECGKQQLQVISLKSLPDRRRLAGISAGTPMLAISAMGQFVGNATIQSTWSAVGRWLRRQGHTIHALSPCPRIRWNRSLATIWPMIVWDRGQRLPRRGGLQSLPANEHDDTSVELLLDWLAPATLIESPLLRNIRLLMGTSMNVGTEWDAWYHADCWQSMASFGLIPNENYVRRLKRRMHLAEIVPELEREVNAAIQKQHNERYSLPITIEAELRVCFSESGGVTSPRTIDRFTRIVNRLRLIAKYRQSDEGREYGLPEWFVEMVSRLSPEMRSHESVRELISHGLALCYTWSKEEPVLPVGVDADEFANETRAAGMRVVDAAVPVDYVVGLDGSYLTFDRGGTDTESFKPIAQLLVGGGQRIQVDLHGTQPETLSLQLDGKTSKKVKLRPIMGAMTQCMMIRSSHAQIEVATIERPRWADRIWQDRFGTAAELRVGDVPFILRWIPPGRFLMGSPDSENARDSDEGPQHEVTISQGFWLGETPLTQEQWSAVIDEGAMSWTPSQPTLKREPSYFKGTKNLPVEKVSWHDCNLFCQWLTKIVEKGLEFRLPNEAEWEYACRAGTQGAFHVPGSQCSEPEGKDSLLDELGWFRENSEETTHPVKEKRPNTWGLYDMHGNVWEWCLDGRRGYDDRDQIDPEGPIEEGADRVLRGGSLGDRARDCRAAYRLAAPPDGEWEFTSIRLSAGQEQLGAER